MKDKQYLAYYAAPMLFLLMLVDTQLTQIFSNVTENVYVANSHLFLIALMVGCQVLPKRYMLLTGLVLGLLFDSYYIGVIGIYAVTIPGIIWLMYVLRDILYSSIFIMFFGTVILVTVYEILPLAIQVLFNLTSVKVSLFASRFLGPTLLINLLLFVLFIFPFKGLFGTK